MKKYLLMIPLLLLSSKALSRETGSQTLQTSEINHKAEFPGDDEAFRKEFMNMVHAFKNNEMFVYNMKYVARKMKGKWKPAVKNGIPEVSESVMKVNFSHNTYDHD